MGEPIKEADHKFTYKDYCEWPDDERWELIDGVAYNMGPAPSSGHQRISRRFSAALGEHLGDEQCEFLTAPVDVFFLEYDKQDLLDATTVVQPDIVVMCDQDKIENRGCVGPPDLVVEILSPRTSKKDQAEKFEVYQAHGVPEYWIVDLGNRYVRVYCLRDNGRYDFGTLYEREGTAVSSVLAGFAMDIEHLFREPL